MYLRLRRKRLVRQRVGELRQYVIVPAIFVAVLAACTTAMLQADIFVAPSRFDDATERTSPPEECSPPSRSPHAEVSLVGVWSKNSRSPSVRHVMSDDDDLAQRVTQLFSRRCLSCHSEDEAEGEFVLTSRADLVEGGYVEEGSPDSSYLIDLIEHEPNETAEMPKDGEPLTRDEIEDVRQWIAEGAIWPEGLVLQPSHLSDRNWWSLQPITRPKTPTINVGEPSSQELQNWARNPIDRFVLARMLEQGLSPSPRATRAELLRRVYYDLIGLPPSPAEIEDFVNDPTPDAYERRVDQLLASPQYGERWARHWLDVVHYADTHGYDKDKQRPNAWPYRDYVIRALNDDRPYDRFVREQVAGDVLFPETSDGLVATGFIAAGPWDFIGHAEVPESKLDGKVARSLDRDDMVSTTLNSFCSLTIQCARCHHHKLDPVTMEDYYRLQAVFAAIDRADREYDVDPVVAQQRHHLRSSQAKLEEELSSLRRKFKDAKPSLLIELETKIRQMESQLADARSRRVPQSGSSGQEQEGTLNRSPRYGYHSQVAADPREPKWVQVDLGKSIAIDWVWLFGADEYGFADFGFPEAYRIEVSDDPTFQDATLLTEETASDQRRPGTKAVRIAGNGIKARFVRVTATQLWKRRRRSDDEQSISKGNDWIFALGELLVTANGQLAPIMSVTSKDSIEAMPRWGRQNLIDRITGAYALDWFVGSDRGSPTNGYHSEFASIPDTEKWVQFDFGEPTKWDRIELIPAFPTDWKDVPGFGFPSKMRIEVSDDASFEDCRVVASMSEPSLEIPGGHSRFVDNDSELKASRYLRVTATSLWDRGSQRYAFALSELRVLSHGVNIAPKAALTAADSIDSGRWNLRYLADGHTSRFRGRSADVVLVNLTQSLDVTAQAEKLEGYKRQQMLWIANSSALNGINVSIENTRQRLQEIRDQLDALPDPQHVYAGTVHQGSGAFRGRAGLGPREIHVLHRGDVGQPRVLVRPGTVPLRTNETGRFDLPEEASEGERRVALANWIVRSDHPLTWRSIANRIWQYHFGRGLVESPNDFGRGGLVPSHPQLLDWLAIELQEHDQSLKHLHRLMCTSATYQQTSQVSRRENDTIDPLTLDVNNRWLWRMNRRRLSAEETRDSFLIFAGLLNEQMGGPGFQDFVIEHPEHSPHYEYEKYDLDDHTTHRRAIYRFIVRSQPQPLMTALDCADPSISVPVRDETLTAIQALALMNNRFATYVAEKWSERLASKQETLRDSLRAAFIESTTRPPTAAELDSLESYAKTYGLANACRVLLNLNEVVFVD